MAGSISMVSYLFWKKEIWHTGGYTNAERLRKAATQFR